MRLAHLYRRPDRAAVEIVEPSRKLQEHVVGLLEQHLSPEARVGLDEDMPVLGGKSGRTHQCDVVVGEGDESRTTRTLVAVQAHWELLTSCRVLMRDGQPDEA